MGKPKPSIRRLLVLDRVFPDRNPSLRFTISLVGIGGTGSHLLERLARIHMALCELGKPGLLVLAHDPDQIDPHTPIRQHFRLADIGQNKAHAAIARINGQYGLDWVACDFLFDEKSLENEGPFNVNMVITCVDQGHIRNVLHKHRPSGRDNFKVHASAKRLGLWMDVGNDKHHGQVVLTDWRLPTIVNHNGLYDTVIPEGSCSLAASLRTQDLLVNDHAAMHAAQMLWELLNEGSIGYHAVWFNLQKGIVQRSLIEKLQHKTSR